MPHADAASPQPQRAKLMLELVPLMIQAGKGREALEEIEL